MDANAPATPATPAGSPPADAAPADDILARLDAFIDTDVRPFLQQDGGDIELVGYEKGVVKVRLQGACGTCPSSIMTLKFGVERRLQEVFPSEVQTLEMVDSPLQAGGHHGHPGHGHF